MLRTAPAPPAETAVPAPPLQPSVPKFEIEARDFPKVDRVDAKALFEDAKSADRASVVALLKEEYGVRDGETLLSSLTREDSPQIDCYYVKDPKTGAVVAFAATVLRENEPMNGDYETSTIEIMMPASKDGKADFELLTVMSRALDLAPFHANEYYTSKRKPDKKRAQDVKKTPLVTLTIDETDEKRCPRGDHCEVAFLSAVYGGKTLSPWKIAASDYDLAKLKRRDGRPASVSVRGYRDRAGKHTLVEMEISEAEAATSTVLGNEVPIVRRRHLRRRYAGLSKALRTLESRVISAARKNRLGPIEYGRTTYFGIDREVLGISEMLQEIRGIRVPDEDQWTTRTYQAVRRVESAKRQLN